jgi:hypothetical protein
MLVISKEKMKLFEKDAVAQFVEKMQTHLKDVFPDLLAEKSDAQIEREIRDGIDQAAGFDITGEQEVALFIDLTVSMGKDFATQKSNPWIQPVLERSDMTGMEKMDFVYGRLLDG